MKSFDKKFGVGFLSDISQAAGIYVYYGRSGVPIYVGKAKNLRRRIGQYRNARRCKKNEKMRTIVREAVRIEITVCSDHEAACLEEARLIQELRPKWNVAGAFFFLYPMVGLRTDEDIWELCYTSRPEDFPDFRFFGAFRSREITGEAFFSLTRLLRYVGHSAGKPVVGKRSYVFRFRKIAKTWDPFFSAFFRGESRELLEKLILTLVENADARSRGEEIQEHLNALARFWRHEARRLHLVLKKLQHPSYPVSQKERDLLFLRKKFLVVEDKMKTENTMKPGARPHPNR